MNFILMVSAVCDPPRAKADIRVLLALGISEEVTTHGLKGNKKRKSRKLDEDFTVSQVALRLPNVAADSDDSPSARAAAYGGGRCPESGSGSPAGHSE